MMTSALQDTVQSARRQRLLILVGVVGSGKTTLAQEMVKTGRWVRASQDDAPTRRRQECEAMVRSGLRQGKDVVVDRVGFDYQQRAHFLNIAKEFPNVDCYCLIFEAPRSALEARLRQRTNHPTIKDATQAMRILGIMLSTYRPPNRDVPEGFKRLFVLPFSRQPAGGMWTEELIEQLLQDVETSPDGWSDDGKPVAWTHSPPAASSGPGRGSWRGRGQSIGFRPYSRPPIEHGFVGQDPPPGGYRYQARPQHISPQLAFRPGQSGGQTMLGFRADSWHTRTDRPSQPPPQQ